MFAWSFCKWPEARFVPGGGQCVHRPPQLPPDIRIVERGHSQPSGAPGLQVWPGENRDTTFTHCPHKHPLWGCGWGLRRVSMRGESPRVREGWCPSRCNDDYVPVCLLSLSGLVFGQNPCRDHLETGALKEISSWAQRGAEGDVQPSVHVERRPCRLLLSLESTAWLR